MYNKNLHQLISLFVVLIVSFVNFGSVLARDGSLDPTFGTGGIVTTDFGTTADQGYAVAMQSDGKIVMAGVVLGEINTDFALARYNRDGSLDNTFDTNGMVITDFGSDRFDYGYAVVIQPDGKIIIAGESSVTANTSDFGLARYNPDGSLDSSFDTDGKVITDFGSDEQGHAITLQPDGRIVVAGHNGNGSNYDFALARYNSDGSLDTSLDSDGKVITDFGSNSDLGSAVALQPDGKLVVAGTTLNSVSNSLDFALARYNEDGSLDTTFDVDGKVITNFVSNSTDNGNAVALQADGKIVVAGFSYDGTNYDYALARYNIDGSLDISLDTDGKVTTDFDFGSVDQGEAIVLQPDGKIVVAGASKGFALARYNPDGSLDSSFDADGKVSTNFGGSAFGYDVTLQLDGKIIVAGYSWNGGSDFALARYDATAAAIEVTMDIKPGRPQNRLELEKNVCKDDDNLYVAILTTPDFDAQTVDASTLQLGDPNLSGKVSPLRSRLRDVDLDGDLDLVLAFPLCKLVTNGGLNKNSTELVLIGKTLDGNPIMGKDLVKVVRDD
jgi:uncharacterized delta-60 repeat protein